MGIKLTPETIAALQAAGVDVGTPPETPPAPQGVPPQVPPAAATPITINLPGVPPKDTPGVPVVQPQSTPGVPTVPQPASTQAILANAGVTEQMLRQEMMTHGGLTQATFSKLAGIDNAYLNSLYENVKLSKQVSSYEANVQKTFDQTIHGAFGGEQNFKAVVAAIRPNMSDAEVTSINSMLNSKDTVQVQSAINYLKDKQKQFAGHLNLVAPQNMGNTTAMPHMSRAEFRKVIASKEYQTDPNYRAQMNKARLEAKEWESKTFSKGQYWRRDSNGNLTAI